MFAFGKLAAFVGLATIVVRVETYIREHGPIETHGRRLGVRRALRVVGQSCSVAVFAPLIVSLSSLACEGGESTVGGPMTIGGQSGTSVAPSAGGAGAAGLNSSGAASVAMMAAGTAMAAGQSGGGAGGMSGSGANSSSGGMPAMRMDLGKGYGKDVVMIGDSWMRLFVTGIEQSLDSVSGVALCSVRRSCCDRSCTTWRRVRT